MTRPTIAILSAAFALAATVSGAAQPSASAPSGQLVFQKGGNLHVVNLDGSGLRLLARRAVLPAVSPDGSLIVYVRPVRDGHPNLWVMNADGSGHHRLTTSGWSPAWAPDGKTIFFTGDHPLFDETLFRIRVDGTARRVVPGRRSCTNEVAPSPEGRLLVFVQHFYRTGCSISELSGPPNAMTMDGREVTVLRKARSFNWRFTNWPAWSPDGRLLAWQTIHRYEATAPPIGGIYVAAPDGSALRRLTTAPGAPAWSPDGEFVAFAARGSLWVIGRDGTGRRRIADIRTTDYISDRPAWMPAPSD